MFKRKITSETKRWNDSDLADVFETGRLLGNKECQAKVQEKIKSFKTLTYCQDCVKYIDEVFSISHLNEKENNND